MKKSEKAKVIKKYQSHDKNTGSPEVQIAILSERIKELTEHLKMHKKDKHSRRGLIGLVAKRRKHLQYLHRRNPEAFAKIVKAFKLKAYNR